MDNLWDNLILLRKNMPFPQNRIFFSGEPPIFVGKFIGTSPKSDIVRQSPTNGPEQLMRRHFEWPYFRMCL